MSWCLCFIQSGSVVSASHWPSLQSLKPVIVLLLWHMGGGRAVWNLYYPLTSHFLKLLASTYSLIRVDIVWCSLLLSLQNENARLSWTVFGTPWLEATTAITLPLRLCLSLHESTFQWIPQKLNSTHFEEICSQQMKSFLHTVCL